MGLFNKNKSDEEIKNEATDEVDFSDIDPTVVDATDEDIASAEAEAMKEEAQEVEAEAPVIEPKEDKVIEEPEEDESPMSPKAQAKAQKEAEKREKEEAKKKAQAEAEAAKHAHLEDLGENKKGKKQKETPVFVFNRYKFAVKIAAFAILIAFGIFILVRKDLAHGFIYFVSGIVIAFAAIVRLVPLLKTTKSHEAKLVSLIECIADLVIGVYVIVAGCIQWNITNDSNDFMKHWNNFNLKMYGWLMMAVLLGRQLAYSWVVILCGEKTDRFKFWVHQIIIGCAVVIALFTSLDPEDTAFATTLIYVLAVISFCSAAVIGGEGGLGYIKYRKSISAPKEKNKETGKEAPARDINDISDVDPNSIPVDDGGNRDSIVM